MSREEHRKGKIEIDIHDSLYTLADYPWRKITEWFEYHLAVKWYVIQAMMDGKEAGFLHLVPMRCTYQTGLSEEGCCHKDVRSSA